MNTPQHRQQWILEELKKSPLISYAEMWGKYGAKWGKMKTTFDKDWKASKEKHLAYQKKVEQEKERVSIETEAEAQKKGLIISKIKALEILSEIARGNAKKIDGNLYMPSFRERISAVGELSKMLGWNVPIKNEITGKDGKDLINAFKIEVIDKREDVKP